MGVKAEERCDFFLLWEGFAVGEGRRSCACVVVVREHFVSGWVGGWAGGVDGWMGLQMSGCILSRVASAMGRCLTSCVRLPTRFIAAVTLVVC